MTKVTSLGRISSSVDATSSSRPPTIVAPPKEDSVKIVVNPSLTDKVAYNQSSILCCILTTLLVGSGVGIAIWYAIVEI